MMLTLCIVPMLFSLLGCQTDPGPGPDNQQLYIPDRPGIPLIETVIFQDLEGTGLILTYDNYRKLERNIIEYRRYIKELEQQNDYFRIILEVR